MSDCGETVESVVGQAFLPVEPFNPGRRERLPYNSGGALRSQSFVTYDFPRNRSLSSAEAAFWARRLKEPSF